MKLTKKQIAEIYKNWDNLSLSKIRLGDDCVENIWVKVSSCGNFHCLDNNPLNPEYRWQDIIDAKSKIVVHRRWNGKICFKYEPATTNEKDIENRKEIYKKLHKLGNVVFFCMGFGYVLTEEEPNGEIVDQILKATQKSS